MYHEATACHVSGDLLELLSIVLDLMKCLRMYRENKDVRGVLLGTKEWVEVLRKLATLLNTYNSSEMRASCIGKHNMLFFPLFELTFFFSLHNF
jgi:ubiquitin carboxyl-terminal hydrolase 34